MNYTYLLINLASISVPFLFSFHPRLQFYKNWKAFFLGNAIMAAFFLIWDVFFTKMGIWGFNPDFLMGIDLINLPIEEWLFFLCIPYACVFTYHSLNILIKKDYLANFARPFSLFLSITLIITALFNLDKWYTATTFFLTAIFLLIHYFIIKPQYFGRMFLMYFITLIPFFIVNGALTGMFTESPVVWYNDAENLSIRMITIPVEDSIYGMLMLMLNVTLYEYFLKRFEN